MAMIVKKAFRPKGSGSPEVQVGADFQGTASQVRLYRAMGWIEDKPEEAMPVQQPQTWRFRAHTAPVQPVQKPDKPAERGTPNPEPGRDTEPVSDPQPIGTVKRAYRRRDLTAE